MKGVFIIVNEIKCNGLFVEYSYYNVNDIKEFMDNVYKFYYYITKSNMISDNIKRYIENLDGPKLVWFYNQMKEPVKIINNYESLFEYLDIIIENDFKDLTLEIYLNYCEDHFNNKYFFVSGWEDILSCRYKKEVHDMYESQYKYTN